MINNTERYQFVDLVNAFKHDTNDAADFSSKVHNGSGNLPLVIHPYYHREQGRFLDKEKAGKYETAMKGFTLSMLEHNLPVTVFEEEGIPADLLPAKLDAGESGTIYVVRTRQATPEPSDKELSLNKLIRKFKHAGVTNAQLAGAYLQLEAVDTIRRGISLYEMRVPTDNGMKRLKAVADKLADCHGHENVAAYEWINHNLVPTGCVGYTAIKLLAQGINVRFVEEACFQLTF